MEIFGHVFFSSFSTSALVLLSCAALGAGVLLIYKGGDGFVAASSALAQRTGVPKIVIGATVVSFATTLPELLVSLRAFAEGSESLAVGNAVGSVTANTALIMGISLCACAGTVEKKSFAVKGSVLVISCVLLYALCLGGKLPVYSAALLWVFFLFFMVYNIFEGKRGAGCAVEDSEEKSLPRTIIMFAVCALAVVAGSELLVACGRTLASAAGVSEGVIGFTVIALGTSLPELVTTIAAVRKKEASLSVGNIIGANIIDLTLILPLCSVWSGKALNVEKANLMFDFPVCLLACIIAVLPTAIRGRFSRRQGGALIALYAAYIICLFSNVTP